MTPSLLLPQYTDSSSVRHGFLRQKSNGSFTTVDVPGADLTAAFNINSEGDVAGVYLIAGVSHGFVRYSDGSFVVIDFPGAASTIGGSINERGDLSGAYVDNAGVEHGFIRLERTGAFTGFDAPGAIGTEGHKINDRGQVVGPFCPTTSCLSPGPQHGYLRSRDGTFILIDVPGALLTW